MPRIRKRAESNDYRLATEEAATLEAELLRAEWHGERRGARSFAEAVNSYLTSSPRSDNTRDLLNRLLLALGDIKLGQINQQTLNRAARVMLAPKCPPGNTEAERNCAAAGGHEPRVSARLV